MEKGSCLFLFSYLFLFFPCLKKEARWECRNKTKNQKQVWHVWISHLLPLHGCLAPYYIPSTLSSWPVDDDFSMKEEWDANLLFAIVCFIAMLSSAWLFASNYSTVYILSFCRVQQDLFHRHLPSRIGLPSRSV